jgi:hypothetical protein
LLVFSKHPQRLKSSIQPCAFENFVRVQFLRAGNVLFRFTKCDGTRNETSTVR